MELDDLINFIVAGNPQTTDDVIQLADQYFSKIVWSLLKDEWTSKMSRDEKEAFARKVLQVKRK